MCSFHIHRVKSHVYQNVQYISFLLLGKNAFYMHSLHEYVKKAVRFPKLAPRFPNPNLKKTLAARLIDTVSRQ